MTTGFIQNTNTNTRPGLSYILNTDILILNGSLHTSDIFIKLTHTYIESAALAQFCPHPGHSCKKYDFLPVGNFLFMSEFRSIQGDSGYYLIHRHPSPEVTPALMMQDAVKPSVIKLNKIQVFLHLYFFNVNLSVYLYH